MSEVKTVSSKKEEVKVKAGILAKKTPERFVFRLIPPHHVLIDETLKSQYFNGGGSYGIVSEINLLWAYKLDNDGNPLLNNKGEEVPYAPNEECPKDHNYFQVRTLRYVPSEKSVFVDEQKIIEKMDERGKERILSNPLRTDKLKFARREIIVNSSEKNLFYYLRFNPQAMPLHPNVRQLTPKNPVYEYVDFEYQDRSKVYEGVRREEAYELARNARKEVFIPHAKYLGISLITPNGLERDTDAIRSDYKEKALSNHELFLKSYNDPKIKSLYEIQTLVENGELRLDDGSAKWVKSGTFIVQIPANQDKYDFLASYSLTEEGDNFSSTMRAIYNTLKQSGKTLI